MPSNRQSRVAGRVDTGLHAIAGPVRKERAPETDRGGKPGLTPDRPLIARLHHMRRNLIAVYCAGAALATLVAANSAMAATWIRR
jgi:hypothetical protein